MSPSAEPAMSAAFEALMPIEQLQDGEAVILAVKPSRWFVLLGSWPWLALAAIVAGWAYLAAGRGSGPIDEKMVALVCSAVACSRVTVGCFQWQGRWYVLTNRRVLRFRGVFRQDVDQCALKDIGEVYLTATLPERLVSVGSLWFEQPAEKDGQAAGWQHLAQPREVRQAVVEAWRRAR